jgi:hypothetical protein
MIHQGFRFSRERPPEIMSEHLTLELTQHQRNLVLEGLRYIRSARRFEFREPSAGRDERRETDLRTISELMGQLDPASAVSGVVSTRAEA